MERIYQKLKVTAKAERALRAGHPWVYAEEVTETLGLPENGDIVDVYSQKERWLGAGFYNNHSKILVRVLSRNPNDRFDEAFFERRIRYAIAYRKTVMGKDFEACRLIFGEADTFPGFTVDRFGDVLVTEVLSLGIERRRDMLYRQLLRVLAEEGVQIRTIYERCDAPLRDKEGLERRCGVYPMPGLTGSENPAVITENGLRFTVDFVNGQKTGYFLDQKYNRSAAAWLAPGRRVLDCFTHTGAFALCAAAAGAEHVTAVDISEEAIAMARHNARLNGLEEQIDFVCEDVFDFLTRLEKEGGHPYDYVILDPPAFTKSRTTVESAYRGYKDINYRAMKLLPRGGYLATCSCSHFMPEERFRAMLTDAAADAAVSLRQIEARQQGPDHPILWGIPETDYLKFFLFQVI